VKGWFGMPLYYYCPVGLVLPLHYSAIIEKSGSHFVQKEVVFTMKILVSSILVQYSEEIPALNDTISSCFTGFCGCSIASLLTIASDLSWTTQLITFAPRQNTFWDW